MTTFAAAMAEDRRLVILRLLSEDTDFSLNARMLQTGLKLLGHNASLDAIHADLAWLQDVAAVTVATVHGDVQVATLTERGRDHVEKRAVIPGIKRPSPGG
jgi:hypothetical protein